MKTKSNRGGKREGAGRPPSGNPKRNVNIYIDTELVSAIDLLRGDKPRSLYISEIIEERLNQSN